MRLTRPLTLAISSVLLAACAGAPQTLPPVPAEAHSLRMSEARAAAADKGWGTDIEGTDFSANGARGSATVGVLFGVIGVAANVAHVNSVNRERAGRIQGLADLDLRRIAEPHLGAIDPAAKTVVIPTGGLSFLDDERFEVTCQLKLDARNGAKSGWVATYTYRPGKLYEIAKVASAADLQTDIEGCFKAAAALANEHRSGRHGTATMSKRWVRGIDGATVEMVGQWSNDAGAERLVMRLPFGLQEWGTTLKAPPPSP